MKKILYSICWISVLFVSCGSDDDSESRLTCVQATQNTLTSLNNLSDAGSNDYETLCATYKITLQQQKDACGDPDGFIQTAIDNLGDCTVTSESSD